MKYRDRIILIIFIGLCLVSLLVLKRQLNNKIIGTFDRSGLHGEILMQENFFYNFKKGNILKFFKTDYFNYPNEENLGFKIFNSFHLYMYIPLRFFWGAIESYNVLVVIVFLLNFLAAYILGKYLFSLRPIALCSALVFAVNSYVFLKMNLGFIQKYTLFWIPL